MKSIILVVEDEPLIRIALADMLINEGYGVLEAGTADEALGMLGREPKVDLLLTDHDMPGSMNGAKLVRWAFASQPSLGVIVMSGAASRDKLQLPSGVLFVGKPYQESEVLRMIRSLLADLQANSASRTVDASLA